jgi:DNA-binding response OmpR family regulator
VLLAIEDPKLGDALLAAIAAVGHNCDLCRDRRSTRRRMTSGEFAAAIVDLQREAGDGVALLSVLRASAPNAWIVALLPPLLHPEPTMGYDVALAKPVAVEAVLAALARRPS